MMKKISLNNQTGFTIVELMIATAVFSTILVLVTVMMTSMGKLYNKGINEARIQDNVRTTTDDVAQNLRLSNGFREENPAAPTSDKYQAYCIGTARYTYVLNKRINQDGDDNPRQVLWRDSIGSQDSCDPVDLADASQLTDDGNSLVGANTQLLSFTISGTSPYSIHIAEAFADNDDLLDMASGQCRGGAGDEFCATAALNTTVVKRLR